MTYTSPTDMLQIEEKSGVLHVWFNNVERRNALAAEMVEAFSDLLDNMANDRDIRALVLRGRGGVFCAGGDIKGFKESQGQADKQEIAAGNRTYGTLLLKLRSLPQVTVMAVEGGAIGGGLGMACVGDITITTADTRFALTETSLGIPPAQIALFVKERVGMSESKRLMLTGARFKGEEAVRLGIAHYCVKDAGEMDSLLAKVLVEMSRCAPMANAATKAILEHSRELSSEDLLDFAAEQFADCMLGNEAGEGVKAFLEKRKPKWAMESG